MGADQVGPEEVNTQIGPREAARKKVPRLG
jgi:hypothetical protein